MKPLTRKEFFMAKAAGQSVPDLEPITREEYFLNQIAESGGGGGLPPIEEGDEGKVLTASDGEAVWASGGGGCFFVTGHFDEDKELVVLDYTWNEIYEASQNNFVILKNDASDPDDGPRYEFAYLECISAFTPSNVYEVFFVSFPSGNKTFERFLTNSADGYPEYWED